ncbi:MAG: isoprenyl transferase [Erysipelotrichaceae bacterium]|jgi:undecaprenyl diphosphate synthase|nr:isoprenyl transferase [Erysipelotrichaceae bacterium]MBQ1740254.1 isoprenyl transferase [Erysipelotrichaceae bacterium]MBQ1775261.1 isoprenyl transferase [Erysipelotrichaceae bacterium]MBQ1811202.1 isoprenyl transferase [Erysipelotrichaceae bacterium]MBQ1910822.1 isoprenyl transferase [Erysipelotrichaceae bacterium]
MNTLNHLAIIMDGNGRWAKQNKLPRTAGHYKGVEVLRNITIYANRLGIKCLTVYAFSTENWKRSADEVNYIMSLPKIFFASYIKELMENNVRVMIIGDRERIPAETMRVIDDAINTTRNNTGLILNFAFNYGARDEIVRAAKAYAKDYKDGKVSDLDEEGFASYLYTKDLPEVDLLIRTGSEMRLSNFLLYQLAYSEFVVIDTLWPDFNNEVLDSCIKEYQSRKRNFGGRDETKSN